MHKTYPNHHNSYTNSKVKLRPLPKCKLGKTVSTRLRNLMMASKGAPVSAWWNQKLMQLEDDDQTG